MKYGVLAGEPRAVSRLVLGIDHQPDDAAVERQCDAFFEVGGNAFDTAFHYEGWRERALGKYLEQNRLQQAAVVIVKGGHTPFCTPAHVDRQLLQSLENLRLGRADVFLLHRDNPQVPVGELMDCLARHQGAGRIGVLGVSNWTTARIEEANRYAAERGLPPLAAVSNQFGLVEMDPPVWEGARSSSTPEARAWHERTQLPLLAYTALGRGFLSGQTKVGARAVEIEQSFDTDANRQRRERARMLATQRGVSLSELSLAYVLCQPFPTFLIIGPRSHEQLSQSLPCLELELTPAELRYLSEGALEG